MPTRASSASALAFAAVLGGFIVLCFLVLAVPSVQADPAHFSAVPPAPGVFRPVDGSPTATPTPGGCTNLTGAIFTTDSGGNAVNQNIYQSKQDVYLQGGPDQQGAHVPDGTYYYKVTDPSGSTDLFQDGYRTLVVTGGVFPSIQLYPFDDTPNSGGQYKVWLSTSTSFDNSCTKTDSFKVVPYTPTPTETQVPEVFTPTPTETPTATLTETPTSTPTETPTTSECTSLKGAIFTTDAGGNAVNQNIYLAKQDVYLHGTVPDGTYYYRVTDPSGGTNLFSDGYRTVVVVNGIFPPKQLFPFSDTPNPGGEYKVWLSVSANFDSPCTKTDNFKVIRPTPTKTASPTATTTVAALQAFCTMLLGTNRSPNVNQQVSVTGFAVSGSGPYAIVAYQFDFGDGSNTGWVSASAWPGSTSRGHAYGHAGRYQVQFFVKLADGSVKGGINTRCAFPMDVKAQTPTPTATPTVLVCGAQPPLFITAVGQDAAFLHLAGLSLDGALIEIQVKGPNDAGFVTNGFTTADAFGAWSYTTTMLQEQQTYQIRARGYGVLSENTVIYTLVSGQSSLAAGTLRDGLGNYGGAQDTYISALVPSVTHSVGITLSVQSQDETDPLARFDLSGIPSNARIVMAKLGLYSLDAEPCTNMVASSFQLLREWDASTATWLTATQGITWNVAGANSTAVDRLGEATYTETVKAPHMWYVWDVTSMVQDWVSDPSSNFGVIVKAWTFGGVVIHTNNELDEPQVVLEQQGLLDGIGGRRDFASSEYPVIQRRPVLYVTYLIP